jgi:hypothetical protein
VFSERATLTSNHGLGDGVHRKVEGRRSGELPAARGDRYQIGNNRGRINGWVGRAAIFGRLIRVEP